MNSFCVVGLTEYLILDKKNMKKIIFLLMFVLLHIFYNATVFSTADNNFLKILIEIDKNIQINKNLKKHNIDDTIILAIIKKESNFKQYAISYKNARGYMQLLLSTAQMIEPDTNQCNIFELERNIRIGIKHLDNLCKTEKTQKDVIQKYYWGNKKQLTNNYYNNIIKLSKKIKVKK
ncbi:MAG: transglycosylase SLT domain-containing protein [Candidatus Omnitrophica bacterium]|nr:transglycosylase SLT domain-containing protein [Candidatus Omnitrophota bacterium]